MLLRTVLTITFIIFETVSGEDNCDDWDLQYKNKCFSLKNESQMKWSDAEKQCEQTGGTLASIHSSDEAKAIQSLSSQKVYGWLGLQKTNGDLEWSDGSDIDFEQWSDEQYFIDDDNFCVLLGSDGLWYKDDCNFRDDYICQKILGKEDGHACGWYLEDVCDDYAAEVISESEEYNPADCQTLCSESSSCQSFRYNHGAHSCKLLSSKKLKGCQLQGGPNNPSQAYCSVYHPECKDVFYTECQTDDSTLLNMTSNVIDAKSCQRICNEDQVDCSYWLYENTEECRLYFGSHIGKCQVITGPKGTSIDDCLGIIIW